MQKCIFKCALEDVIFKVFVERSYVFVILLFSILFSSTMDIKASSFDYPVSSESIIYEPAKVADDEVFDWEEVDGKPEIVKKVDPYYPELARKKGISGLVLVKVLIDTNGDVEKAEIHKSIKELDQAALDAARKFKFTPGTKEGKPVKVKMQIPFKFHLK